MPSELLLNKLLKIPMMLLFCKHQTSIAPDCFYGGLHVYRSTVEKVDTHNMQAVYEEVGESRYIL